MNKPSRQRIIVVCYVDLDNGDVSHPLDRAYLDCVAKMASVYTLLEARDVHASAQMVF